MTLLDYYHRTVPEYYPTMYLDGYTPAQIMYAQQKKMTRQFRERDAEIRLSRQQEKALEDTINRALDDIFKGWK